jgi:hypothetical protein
MSIELRENNSACAALQTRPVHAVFIFETISILVLKPTRGRTFRIPMSTKSSLTARVFVTIFSLLLSINFAEAGGRGHGPSFGGYHPFDHPIPDKPLDGAKQAVHDTGNAIEKTGKAVGPAVAIA